MDPNDREKQLQTDLHRAEGRISVLETQNERRISILEAQRESDLEALRIARREIDRRLEGMNELRDQITSERGIYVTRAELIPLSEKLNDLASRLSVAEGRSVAYAGAVGLIVSVLILALQFIR